MFLPGTAVEIASAAKLSRKTKTFLRGGERKKKGRGYRYEFAAVPKEQASELIEVFDAWLSEGKRGIAETSAVRQAIERLGGVIEPSPREEERRAEAKLRGIHKAQEERLRKQREKMEKKERYEAAVSHWLSNYKPLPGVVDLQGGHALAVEKLNRLAQEEVAATQHVKDLVATRAQIRDTEGNQAERDGLQIEIDEAIQDRNLVRRSLYKQRFKMSSKDRQKAATLPIPQAEEFGLEKKDVQ